MSHRQFLVVAIGVVAGCADISDDDPRIDASEQAVVLPMCAGTTRIAPQLLSSAVTAPKVIGTSAGATIIAGSSIQLYSLARRAEPPATAGRAVEAARNPDRWVAELATPSASP